MAFAAASMEMEEMKTFNPDLVIEVTSACNRACTGCYAPNVVSNKSAEELMAKDSSLFMNVEKLRSLIQSWTTFNPEVVSIRGGEPSLHPQLANIIFELSKFNSEIFLETHGRWLLESNKTSYLGLINALSMSNSTLKISFDSMHRLNPVDLNKMTDYLSALNIQYVIAITEKTDTELMATRNLCPWISDDQIIFQHKADKAEELLKPTIGVINVKTEMVETLNYKFDIREMIKEMAI